MTKEEVLEKLKEERESAKSKILYGQSRNLSVKRYGWYFNGVDYAIDLAEKLDEPKKVIVPKFVANDIDRRKKKGSTLRIFLEDTFDWRTKSDVYYWFFADGGDENFMKYISAWNNGYEVKKEPKYHVKIKHFNSSDNALYVNHNNARGDFFLEGKKQTPSVHTIFTKSYLKSHWTGYDTYNNAGLLEFEEVEDE